jgi:hypothetical protein
MLSWQDNRQKLTGAIHLAPQSASCHSPSRPSRRYRTFLPITMPPEPVARAQSATGTKPVQPSVASADASRSKQQAALTQMLVKYTYDQSHGMDPTTLSALGKQFTAAAKALGQHVSLPHAPPGVAASPIKVSVNA